jgi:hypothetical protein
LAYRCDRVQSQQVYFPQDGWRAIGRNAKELNPELRHRLGVHRYSSRGIQADRLAGLARNRQRDAVCDRRVCRIRGGDAQGSESYFALVAAFGPGADDARGRDCSSATPPFQFQLPLLDAARLTLRELHCPFGVAHLAQDVGWGWFDHRRPRIGQGHHCPDPWRSGTSRGQCARRHPPV